MHPPGFPCQGTWGTRVPLRGAAWPQREVLATCSFARSCHESLGAAGFLVPWRTWPRLQCEDVLEPFLGRWGRWQPRARHGTPGGRAAGSAGGRIEASCLSFPSCESAEFCSLTEGAEGAQARDGAAVGRGELLKRGHRTQHLGTVPGAPPRHGGVGGCSAGGCSGTEPERAARGCRRGCAPELGWRKRPRKRGPGRAGDTAGHVTAGEASPAEVGCLSDPLLPEPAAGTIWLQQAC